MYPTEIKICLGITTQIRFSCQSGRKVRETQTVNRIYYKYYNVICTMEQYWLKKILLKIPGESKQCIHCLIKRNS